MGSMVTNAYDVVFELAEPAFTRQLAALPALQKIIRTPFNTGLLAGRARIHLNHPSAEFKSPVSVSERVAISLDVAGSALIVTQPKQGVIPIEGTLAIGGRVRVVPVAGSPASRQVVLDFTAKNGGPDVLTMTFPANTTAMDTGLQSIGITPNAAVHSLVQQMIVDQARTWILANMKTVPISPPTVIAASPSGPFAVTQLDAHVIEDPAGASRDALAIAMATCGGANPSLNATLFTSTSVPVGDDAAVMVSNSTLLGCIVCPALAGGLGIPPGSFAAPCTLTTPFVMTVSGIPVTITTLTATVSTTGVINIRGTLAVTTDAFSVTGTFGVDVTLTLPATPPPGGPAIVPVVTVLPSTASITLAWWVWAAAAVLLPLLFGMVVALAIMVAAVIGTGIANSALATAITTGVAAALGTPGAIPLGPLAASFSPRKLTLDDLMLTGAVTIANPDTNPRLLVVDSLDQAIDAVQLSPRYEGSNTTWSMYVHNRGTQPLNLTSITKVDDPSNAFKIPDGALPISFAGGQTNAVPCRFHPATAGRYLPVITLQSNDPFGPAQVDIEAEAVALPPHGRLDIKPTPLAFGKVLAKSSTTMNLTLANVGNASLDVTNVALTAESPAGWFVLPWSWPGTIAAGQSPALPIGFEPSQTGAASASLIIDMSSAGGLYTEHHVTPLTGTAGAPVIRLTPTPLDFGALAPGASATQTLTIHNDGDMDLVVQAIYRTQGQPDFWFDPPVTLPLTVAAGGQVALDVTTTAAPSPGYVNTNEFEVASNDPFTPGARVLCRCTTAGPRIEVQPDFVEFQRPPVVPAQATITIYNRGSSQLDVEYVQVTSPPFNLVGVPASPFSVPAAGQQQFQVEYAPTKTGIFTAYVQVRSNDALRPTVGVGLHGHW